MMYYFTKLQGDEKMKIKSLFCVILIVIMMSTTAFGASFTDTEGHWAEDYIEKMAQAGYVKGYGDGTFNPDGPMTRAEVATVLTNVFAIPHTIAGHKVLKDVNETDWFMPYSLVGYLVFPPEEGNAQIFRGNDKITRVEAAHAIIALYNCAESTGYAAQMADYDTFKDNFFVKKVVSTAVKYGIMQGKGETGFEPFSTLTRAELCTLVMRTLENKGDADKETLETLTDFTNQINEKYSK
ncbi:MAG: S-layer homology domain-containing protein [Ruminococcaceae bacterium]|nr:S-layer homology domain-containing protein [Oscillospiraceae bacterium]